MDCVCYVSGIPVDIELTPEQQKDIKTKFKSSIGKRVPRGSAYYYLDSVYNVQRGFEDFMEISNTRFGVGNYYTTVEAAKKAAAYYILHFRLRSLADQINDPIDWEDRDLKKYYINYDEDGERLEEDFTFADYSYGTVYFSSEEKIQLAIEIFGDELLEYYKNTKREGGNL